MQARFSQLIPTKFISHQRAAKNETQIERADLLAKLDQAKCYPLTLVVAPAGYGKTTLVAQWQAQQEAKHQRVGWLSLDEGDNQAVQFAEYFTAALSKATELSFAGIAYQGNLLAYFSQLLIPLTQIQNHFYLVLDDYHCLHNSEIHDAMRFWLKHQPACMSLILVSRLTPPLSMTNFRIHEQLLEIDSTQLAFSTAEAAQFLALKLNENLPEEKVALLCEQVEGWATALQLIAITAKSQPDLLQFPEKLLSKLNQQHIADYLDEEVFYHIAPETKRLMQRCAILRVMNEKLVQAVSQDSQGVTKLYELEKSGLFIRRYQQENGEVWWQFHPILAAYLLQSCRLELSNEWQKLHKIASQVWLTLGHSSDALFHAEMLDETQTVYTLLQSDGWKLFHQGQLKLLESSLNRLPAEQLWQDSNLVLLKAWLAQSQHRYHEVAGILQKFQPNQPLAEDLQAHFDALKAQVAINEGNDEQAYRLAKQAMAHFSSHVGYAQVVANSIIGEAQHCRGYLKEGLGQMQKVEKMALAQHAHHQWLWSKLQQAEILSAQGFWQSAYDLLKETSHQAKPLHRIPMYEFLLRLKGQILWEWHHLEQAEKMANAGIALLEKESEQLQCLALLAKISLTRGDLNNAARLIEQARDLLASCDVHRDWRTTFDEVQMLYWQIAEDKSQLEGWLAQTNFPTKEHNHFLQRQWRNIARAYLLQDKFDQALNVVNRLLQTSVAFNLISDTQRSLILRNRIYFRQGKWELAQKDLIQALNFSQQTNFISAFVIEGDLMAQQIRQLLQFNVLDELATHKAKFILRSINQHNRHKFAHFDEEFVNNLLKNPQVPELLKISPLTSREWQVLGLIYSGYSNEQISQELVVAITTIKTHIRNLYQKIGVENRNEAIEYTRSLLKMMGYH